MQKGTSVETGHKLKQEKAEKFAAKIAGALEPGEQIVFMTTCNNMRPTVDRLVVTDRRLLAANTMDRAPKFEVTHTRLLDVISNPKKQTLLVQTADGREQTLKFVPAEDHAQIVSHLNAHRSESVAGTGVSKEVLKDLVSNTESIRAEAAAPTDLQMQAIREGFPEKHRELVEPLLAFLNSAAEAAVRGDIPAEELAIYEGEKLSNKAGILAIKGPRWYDERVLERAGRGELRRNADLLGVVGASLVIMSDRIVQQGRARLLDADVRASVESDGQVLQSTRPTLTRMAFGSVLPGSALLVGLAVPKTNTKDSRTAQFVLVHPKWRIVEKLDPDRAHQLTPLAAQINSIADSRQRRGANRGPEPMESTTHSSQQLAPRGNVADELLKLATLRDSGILTDDEFATAKARLLG